MKVDFARLNHVLIPSTKTERDRFRNGRAARLVMPLVSVLTRLSREGRVLATAVCALSMFGVDVGRTESHVLLFLAAALLVSSLIFSFGYRLKGVTIEARAPRRVALGEEMTISLSLQNKGDREYRSLRVDRPLLPWDGRWLGMPRGIASLPKGERATVTLSARFVARGEHHIDPMGAVAMVPLGLAQGPRVRTEGLRFLVVPKIARVVSVTTPRNRRHQPGGIARASRTGDATDLLGVRPYRPGDPVRDLHARSWARLGFPVVREYQEEYFTRVGVIVDTDVAASTPKHLEAALSLAAGVISSLCTGDSLVDVLVVGERAHSLSLGRSLGTVDQALDVLATVKPGPKFAESELMARIGPHLERLSSVILVTLTWDRARIALVQSIRQRGVGCSAFVVAEKSAAVDDAKLVSIESINSGEPLSL